MDLLIYGLAIVFVGLFAAGWLLLISSVILTASGVVVGLPVLAVSRIRQHLGWSVTRSIEEGILCVEGLAGEVRLASRLHDGLARVLSFAAPQTSPRACVCVKESDAGYVGVMRVFNSKGHYLARATGNTAAAIATQFVSDLEAFTDRFPARVGVPRATCPECDARMCPLRMLVQQRAHAIPV